MVALLSALKGRLFSQPERSRPVHYKTQAESGRRTCCRFGLGLPISLLVQIDETVTLLPRCDWEDAMAMKYVMLKLDGGELLPVLFPEFMQHSHIAQAVPATVVSAGRVYLEDGRIVTHGTSSSLGSSSRAEDSQVIQAYFDGQNGIQQEI
jgi:hypothetical protein